MIKKYIWGILRGLYFRTIWKLKDKKRREDFYLQSAQYRNNKDKIDQIERFAQSYSPQNEEEKEVFEYIKKYGLYYVFPYDFVYNYVLKAELGVKYDNDCGMYYSSIGKKRFYLKQKTYHEAFVYLKNLIYEQDIKSPHRYVDKELGRYDVLFDCGAAEGIFSLEHIDNFEKIVLVECDEDWIKPLEKTFEQYGDKVTIVKKLLSDESDDNNISIDDILDEMKISDDSKVFVKMDIEGSEMIALKGAQKLLTDFANVDMSVCTYHREEDAKNIKEYLESYDGFITEFSKGFMVMYYNDDIKPPYIRRGILRAHKGSL